MKNKLYKIKLAEVQKVVYAVSKKDAIYKFHDYLKKVIEEIDNQTVLRQIIREAVSNYIYVNELKLPLVNTVYYRIGDRVLWHNQPGYIDSYSKTFLGKRYGHQVNYNIKLDDGRSITNSRYDEIVNETTLDPNIEGISI